MGAAPVPSIPPLDRANHRVNKGEGRTLRGGSCSPPVFTGCSAVGGMS